MTTPNKVRRGGVLGTREARSVYEQRVLDGDVRAMRAVLRQAQGVTTLGQAAAGQLTVLRPQFRAAANGTGGTRLAFTGYASVTEVPFTISDWLGDFTEIVHAGAFARTLNAQPDTILAFNHDWNAIPMARTASARSTEGATATLALAEDTTGLLSDGQLDGSRADVYALQSAIEADEVNAMSFAFWVTRQEWSPDYDQRDIFEVDIDGGDVSAVTWPGNPATTGSVGILSQGLADAQARNLIRSRVPQLVLARARSEQLAGKTLSAATLDVLQTVSDLLSTAGVALNEAVPMLSELMGAKADDDSKDDESQSGAAEPDELSGPDPEIVRERLHLADLARRRA